MNAVQIKKYSAKLGSRISDDDAKIIGEVIEKLESSLESGAITAGLLLEEARNSSSPVHRYFQWDDTKAAESYRLEQARQLLRSVCVVVETIEEPVRLTHVVHRDGVRGYVPIGKIVESQDMMQELLSNAQRDLIAWQRKYAMLRKVAKLQPVFVLIDRITTEQVDIAAE